MDLSMLGCTASVRMGQLAEHCCLTDQCCGAKRNCIPALFASRNDISSSQEDGPHKAGVYGIVAVGQLAEQCDMREEVMETLLSYLEVMFFHLKLTDSTVLTF